jgi:hypothetical protein
MFVQLICILYGETKIDISSVTLYVHTLSGPYCAGIIGEFVRVVVFCTTYDFNATCLTSVH